MELKWTGKAQSDLQRLYDFLSSVNKPAAAIAMRKLVNAPTRLLYQPRMGERLTEFSPREVRRIVIGPYEIRYELAGSTIIILRLWHAREDR